MKKSILISLIILSLALFSCSAFPPSQLASPTQLSLPTSTPLPLPSQISSHPAILGKWTIGKSNPLKAKYYGIDAQGGSYSLPFSFELGETGKQIEFVENNIIYDLVAYEYQWVGDNQIKLAANIGFTGTVWLVYDLKLDGTKLSLLDHRDGSILIDLSKP